MSVFGAQKTMCLARTCAIFAIRFLRAKRLLQ